MAKVKANVKENPKANYKVPGSQLYVTRVSNLWRMFSANKTDKSRRFLKFRIYFFSILSTPLQWLQRLIFRFKLRGVDLSKTSPVFILGHWRSGTTHIHYTLAKDKQFVYLNNFQSFFFNICMSKMQWFNKLLAPLVPSTRPMDNMEMTLSKPQEEEQVLSNISTTAGVNSFYFPKNRSYFYKFNLFKGISKKEYDRWKKDYSYILKLIYKLNGEGRLLLKNPNNTARIKQLLELFPNAKFVYIHRNPFQVYLSTKHLHRAVLRDQRLQEITEEEEDNMILENYRLINKGYLETRALVPENSLIEIAYEEVGTESELDMFKRIYETLSLGDWSSIEPKIIAYMDSKKGYKKNRFIPIDPVMVKRIQDEWGFMFEEYGYDLEYKDNTVPKSTV